MKEMRVRDAFFATILFEEEHSSLSGFTDVPRVEVHCPSYHFGERVGIRTTDEFIHRRLEIRADCEVEANLWFSFWLRHCAPFVWNIRIRTFCGTSKGVILAEGITQCKSGARLLKNSS